MKNPIPTPIPTPTPNFFDSLWNFAGNNSNGGEGMNLEGKVALITGGGTGIGAAVARRFVADGAKVCISGRRKELLEQVVASLPPGSIATCAGDVSRQEDVERMVESALALGGKINVLVNNAAMDQIPPANVVDLDPALWQSVLAVNLTGPFFTMKAAIPHMIKNGGGSIINVASVAGIRSIPNMPAYVSSKAGMIALSQQVALDFGPSGIRCNVICPGCVRTEMFEGAMSPFAKKRGTDLDGIFKLFTKDVPLRRVASTDEIGGICSYLASDDGSYMTGVVLPIDGGTAIVDISGAAINSIAN
jgi:meso-butanediol dehydrogenase / (S,S)-butanediol dehydrogenase / diacetyl reductase